VYGDQYVNLAVARLMFVRESGTHMLLDDIPGTQVAIEQFFAKNNASSFH
jgi:hypothetical protein